MTTIFRVDPRLVHATMVNTWVPLTGARTLFVADRNVVEDDKKKMIFEMSAMGEIEVRFCSEHELAGLLSEPGYPSPGIVMFSSLESAVAANESGVEMERLNIGHWPREDGRREVHPSVHLGDDEWTQINTLASRGVEVVVQPLPHDKVKIVARPHGADRRPPPTSSTEPGVAEGRVKVVNERGLHLRAAHVLAHLASSLPCSVSITYRGTTVNAKSLLGLTTLGATMGSELTLRVEGPGAEEAFARLAELFAEGFSEGVHLDEPREGDE